jgi:ASC-1-like (ASCH) protein
MVDLRSRPLKYYCVAVKANSSLKKASTETERMITKNNWLTFIYKKSIFSADVTTSTGVIMQHDFSQSHDFVVIGELMPHLLSGAKPLEIRPNIRRYKCIRPGEPIRFNQTLWCRVLTIARFDTYQQAVTKDNASLLWPGHNRQQVLGALDRLFYRYKDNNPGYLALWYWATLTSRHALAACRLLLFLLTLCYWQKDRWVNFFLRISCYLTLSTCSTS